jgi:hypothetical protein
MMRGEAISHSAQFDDCTGAVLAPVNASVAHLKERHRQRGELRQQQQHERPHHAHLQVGAVARPDIRPQMGERPDQRGVLGGVVLNRRRRRDRAWMSHQPRPDGAPPCGRNVFSIPCMFVVI